MLTWTIGLRICTSLGDLAKLRENREQESEREIHVRYAWSLEISGCAGVTDKRGAGERTRSAMV